MKKIFTLSLVAIATTFLFGSCSKQAIVFDEGYWLSQERSEVVFSDPYCSYIVVETNYGYTIIRSYSNYHPYEGSFIYGDFGRYGVRDFYNRSSGRIFTGEVMEYDLSYSNAQYAVEYYCPYSKGKKIKESAAGATKANRQK